MITFYDIPSRLPLKAWSPNTWKTRYSLNFKQLTYKTEWVEYPDIAAKSKELGLSPVRRPTGSEGYTLPTIHDHSTGKTVSDSFRIAEYLDKTYPSKERMIFPCNTVGIQAPFARSFAFNMKPILNLLIPPECDILNPRSAEYFRKTRVKSYGLKKLEDLLPMNEEEYAKEWAKVKEGLTNTAKWFAKNERSSPFIIATEPCWADFVVGGYMKWILCVWGEDSWQWREIHSWNDGRWKMFVDG